MKALIINFLDKIDVSDIIWFVGMAAIGYGIYQIHRPAAFIVVGLILVFLTSVKKIRKSQE